VDSRLYFRPADPGHGVDHPESLTWRAGQRTEPAFRLDERRKAVLAAFAILCGLGLFLTPEAMSAFWPWAVTPLAARAVSSWLTAFGVACLTLTLENDIKQGAGTCLSLFAFCVMQLVVVARFATAFDFGKPLALAYILFLILGMFVTGGNLLASRRLANI